nr:MAG TPA: hypothetical protein [Siphoviridae sp. ctKRf14]
MRALTSAATATLGLPRQSLAPLSQTLVARSAATPGLMAKESPGYCMYPIP